MKFGTVMRYDIFRLNGVWSALWLVLIASSLAGCLTGSPGSSSQKKCSELPGMEGGGRLSVFVNLEGPGVEQVKIIISQVEILAGESWQPLSEPAFELDSKNLGKGQAFLGSRVILSGSYERLRVTVSEAHKILDGKKLVLKLDQPSVEVGLFQPLELGFQTSAVVLLSWDVDALLDAGSLSPRLLFRASHSQAAHVASNKAYVACPDIDNVYVVRTDKNWVQESFAVSGRPTYMAADAVDKKLYILAAEQSMIKIVDMVSLQVTDEVKIPMTRRSIFMTMAPDYLSAYILDDLGSLVKMDVRNGHLLARVRVGQRPVFVLYLKSQKRVVVSSTEDRALYFLDPDSLETVEKINVAGAPNGLLEWENYLYIAEAETSMVSLFDLNERKFVKSIPAGYSPARLASSADNIYLADDSDSSVSFMKGGQFNVNKSIPVKGLGGEMAVAEYQRLLYVGNGGCDGNLAVIDLTSNRLIGEVALGAKPLGLAVIQ